MRGFVVDVSGHGVATALQTASLSVLLREASSSQLPLQQQVQWINSRAEKYFAEGAYATLLGFELDFAERELRYVGAGITHFYLNGKKVETPGMFVGMWERAEFGEGRLPMKSGDSIYFLTDGFTDAMALLEIDNFWSPGGKDFEADFASLQNLAAGGTLRDDATAVCIHVL